MMISPTTSKVLDFMRDVLELRMTSFQEDMLDAILKSATTPTLERVVLRSRDGLELVTKVRHGTRKYARPLVPSSASNITLEEVLLVPRSREYEDFGARRMAAVGNVVLRVLEER